MPKPRGKRHTYAPIVGEKLTWFCKNHGCLLQKKELLGVLGKAGRRVSLDGGNTWQVEPRLLPTCPATTPKRQETWQDRVRKDAQKDTP